VKHATPYHAPVMVAEVASYLEPERGGVFLDGTLGGGGHAEALLERGAEEVIGVDRDPDAVAEAGRRLAAFGERLRAYRTSFADAVEVAGLAPSSLRGALLDLGVSSHQLDEIGRGFTFRAGSPLDMRMEHGGGGGDSAADLLNHRSEEELVVLFRRYGEERRARRLARVIVEMRGEQPFTTSDRLVEAIGRALSPPVTAQDKARIFQALRIAVNRELEALELGMDRIREALEPHGVFVVLSYHSLEDRIVKNAFREWSRACVCPPALPVCRCRGRALGETLTRKPVEPSVEEIRSNPRARSARLRAWRRA
jgi:16S rRNA (cytosine1402-N4)-methyltransferase